MTDFEKIKAILERIAEGKYTNADFDDLHFLLNASSSENFINTLKNLNTVIGKNIIGEIKGNNIQVGDHIYHYQYDETTKNAIVEAIVRAIKQFDWQCVANIKENDFTYTTLQSTGIGAIDNIAQYMTNFSQQNVMSYGLKLAFSQNQSLEYFISGGDRVIKLWHGQKKTWKIDKEIQAPHVTDLWFTSVAISPDGQKFAACKNYQIKIWRLGETHPIHELGKTLLNNFFDVEGFDSVTFSPDGKVLAASDNQDIKLWDVETGKEIAKLSGHSDKVTCVAFKPKNRQVLASCSYDKTIKVWDVANGECLGTLTKHKDAVFTVVFSPDGKLLASGGRDNSIKLWNLSEGETDDLRQHSKAVTCLVFSPDGKTLISGGNDGKILDWKLSDRESQPFPEEHRRGVTSIAMSPDGKTLISSDRDQTIKVWRK